MAVNGDTAWKSAAARRIVEAAGGETTVEESVRLIVATLREGTSGPPTDLGEAAEKLGVESIRAEPLPVAGELRRSGTTLTIVYASGLSSGRRRFTIAHELGHAYFERSGPRCPRRGPELERICDLFAVELLMPRDELRDAFGDGAPAAVFEAAKRFDVSMTAAMYRLAEVTQFQAVLHDGQRRSATMRELTQADATLDELVEQTRREGSLEAIMRLPRNRVWNGSWAMRASTGAIDRLVLITAKPTTEPPSVVGLLEALRVAEQRARSPPVATSALLTDAAFRATSGPPFDACIRSTPWYVRPARRWSDVI